MKQLATIKDESIVVGHRPDGTPVTMTWEPETVIDRTVTGKFADVFDDLRTRFENLTAPIRCRSKCR